MQNAEQQPEKKPNLQEGEPGDGDGGKLVQTLNPCQPRLHLPLLLLYHLCGWFLHHLPHLWCGRLLLLLSSVWRCRKHPNMLSHLLWKFELKHLPNQHEGVPLRS